MRSPPVRTPAIAPATVASWARLTAQSALLSVMTLPPSFRISRSDILLLSCAFRINAGHNRPRLAGLDGPRNMVFQLLGAERNHAPAATGARDLRTKCPGVPGSKDHFCQLRVTDSEHLKKGVVHVHVSAQFPRVVEVVDRTHTDRLDGIEDRVHDVRVVLLEFRDLLHHSGRAVRYERVPDHEV